MSDSSRFDSPPYSVPGAELGGETLGELSPGDFARAGDGDLARAGTRATARGKGRRSGHGARAGPGLRRRGAGSVRRVASRLGRSSVLIEPSRTESRVAAGGSSGGAGCSEQGGEDLLEIATLRATSCRTFSRPPGTSRSSQHASEMNPQVRTVSRIMSRSW